MTVDEVFHTISKERPAVIYVSGKTSTGKSTFGRKVRDELGYQVIELEAVLLDIVQKQGFDEQSTFRKVLYESGDFLEKQLFFAATDQVIADALNQEKPIVIEGAIANTDTLQRVLKPAASRLFLYFHPDDLEVYIRNLTQRFMTASETSYGGLPLKFWQHIDHEAFKDFCKTRQLTDKLTSSIAAYARDSQQESLTRLEAFRRQFDDITLVTIQ